MTVIYKISSILTNKFYIGSAIKFRYRKNKHLSTLKNGNHANNILQNHVNKYGIEDLVFIIIEEVSSENLIVREQYYIDSLSPEFNICPTAGSALGRKWSESMRQKKTGMPSYWKGKKLSDETRRRMSEAQKGKLGKIHSPETKAKLSARFKGISNTKNLGSKRTAEQRERMKAAKRKK